MKIGSFARRMAYADQPAMSPKRAAALGAAVVVHIVLGYAFTSGLALKAVKVITGPLETFEVEEPTKPEEEPPPPPPELDEIPPYVPPPEVVVESIAPPAPTITVQTEAPRITPPAPTGPSQRATPKGRLGDTITTDDYPDASIRAEEEGLSVIRYSIGPDGRVIKGSCAVAQSSGYSRLDNRACELAERRFRFNPALSNGQPTTDQRTQRIRWQLPK